MKRIVIVGGGAAGLMAAISADRSRPKAEIHLIEQNKIPGKKILITGGGRCNLTSTIPIEEFISKVPENGKFLFSAFAAFSNRDLIRMLEQAGLKLKTEGAKVYPVKDSAQLVVNTLCRLLPEDLHFHTGEKVIGFRTQQIEKGEKGSASLKKVSEESRIVSVRTEKREICADAVIIACGGLSYPATGSDGSVFEPLREIGVGIEPFFPSLVQMLGKKELGMLRGISLSEVRLRAEVGRAEFETGGGMLFTERGISGPAVMDMSAYLTKFSPEEIRLYLDFLPRMSEEELRERMFAKGKKKMENKIADLLPERLLRFLYEDVRERDLGNLKKREKEELLSRIKKNLFEIEGFGSVRESIVTKGGVSLKEVRSSSLEHKRIRGLFFAGECLNVDALTGGYNLQIAFSTGFLAGLSASEAVHLD